LRRGPVRDRLSSALGLARSFQREPARAWRGLRHLCRELAQAVRFTKGAAGVTRFEDKAAKTARSFCARCGTPLIYERARSPHMVNIPRALFLSRTGRQPLYHIGIEEKQEWTYAGEPLVPLKGFPGVVWQRSKKNKHIDGGGPF